MPFLLTSVVDGAKRAHVESWLDDLDSGAERERIVGHNWRTDPNVPAPSAVAFADELYTKWAAGGANSMLVVRDIVEDHHMCPLATAVADPDISLSRVTTFSNLDRRHLNFMGSTTGGVSEDNLQDFLSDFSSADLLGLIRGPQPFAWCTSTGDIAPLTSADDVRDQLGLAHYGLAPAGADPVSRFMEEALVELVYDSTAPPSVHLPTVFEALDGAAFLPSVAGSPCGRTMNLNTGLPAASEYVHPEFPASGIRTPIRYRGRLANNPSENWVAVRLASI
ncbi:MAG: hypothetical protein ABSD58_12770 [Verrucomicrobiia bacterium]|jgi:hypothetical protein